MERTAMTALMAWRDSPTRKPLILRGARQVGKTWLLTEFGRRSFARTIHVNLDTSTAARTIFAGDLNPREIAVGLGILDGHGPIDPENTLIILDEVQETPRALTSLKYFAEQAPEYVIACAGSLLGVGLHAGTSFPVGKVDFLDLTPLTFEEFLAAREHEDYLALIEAQNWPLLNAFHDQLVRELRWYYFVGGMPEAVATLVRTDDATAVRRVQSAILAAYQQDFSKHAPSVEVPKLNAIFSAIPTQLAKENRKFVFGQVWKSARAATLQLALQWLSDAGLVTRVNRVTTPHYPLAAYIDDKAFKLFLVDVGLLAALAEIEPSALVDGNSLFTEFRGALTEQYVAQTLTSLPIPPPRYWSADGATAEVDFVIQSTNAIVPIEVKAATNLQAKSLRIYRGKFGPAVSIRTSLAPYEQQTGGLINLPLYALGALPAVMAEPPSSEA
ncbi:MAG: ATP-binding protein [Propionibacteriaceae bacterium]|nr:ATP-binding protein [Propionibacteriaceae bacterium]